MTTTTTTNPTNRIRTIAIVGAGGHVGQYIVQSLLSLPTKPTITAITRASSTSSFPPSIQRAEVDYDNHASLVSALKGQDVLIITMSTTAPPESSAKLVNAAADAGVPWVLPNEWGGDYLDPSLNSDIILGKHVAGIRRLIEERGVSRWVAIACGFWYGYSLTVAPEAYGFDWERKEVVFYGEGDVKMNTSTWAQCGRAVAALMGLPIQSESQSSSIGKEEKEDGEELTLSSFANSIVRISSFHLTQREMLAAVLRATSSPASSWTIKHQPARSRFEEGKTQLAAGDRQRGFRKLLYARYFYPEGSANDFEGVVGREGLCNGLLGLPVEDLDEETRKAIRDAEAGVM